MLSSPRIKQSIYINTIKYLLDVLYGLFQLREITNRTNYLPNLKLNDSS